jgi:hypothetical protein
MGEGQIPRLRLRVGLRLGRGLRAGLRLRVGFYGHFPRMLVRS